MKHDFTHGTIESLVSKGENIMGLLWEFTGAAILKPMTQ